jgi:hypothetical protein
MVSMQINSIIDQPNAMPLPAVDIASTFNSPAYIVRLSLFTTLQAIHCSRGSTFDLLPN